MSPVFCKTCGVRVSPLEHPKRGAGGYGDSLIIPVASYKTVNANPAPFVSLEVKPQLLANFSVYRNGGPEDVLCADCIKLGLKRIRDEIDFIIGDREAQKGGD